MALATDRASFKLHCLRTLGHPVIQINVDDDQVDDRIDEAMQYYADYHFDGSEKIYYKHQVTQQDITNKYITLPENIIGAVRIFPVSNQFSSNSFMDVRYQMIINDLYTLTSGGSLVPYYMTISNIQFLEGILIGQQPIRYNRHTNKFYVDMDWTKLAIGSYLIIEAYSALDPTTYSDIWKDRWLSKYATALIKRQWGNNLKKYDGMEMTNGIRFNGQRIYEEAENEIEKLEHEMLYTYSLPASDLIG